MKLIFIALSILVACSSHHPQLYTADPEGIRQRIIDELPELRKCATEFAIKEKIESKVSFVIRPDGTTTDHKIVEATKADKPLEDCILQKMAKLKFQPVQNGQNISVRQPINYWRK